MIDSLGTGGAERLVVDVIKGLPQYDHHLILLNGPETLCEELPPGCRVTNLHRQQRTEMYSNSRTVKRYILEQKINLVHAHLFFSYITARLATPRRVSLLNSIHIISSLDNYANSRAALWLDKLTYRKRHHIVAVSEAVLQDFDEWVGLKGEGTVLYNFIRDDFFTAHRKERINKQPLRLVAMGTLRLQKNYPYLLEAFRHLPPNVTLDVYGSGPLHQELQAKIVQHNLPVRLCGNQKGVHRILPDYDAFVMCSHFEGQPLALLEAVASGLPALLSDIPVLREVTGEHAIYFDLNNPLDFVAKVQGVLNGEIDLLKNVEPARQRINSFAHKETYLKALTSLYESKLNPQPSGPRLTPA